MKKKKTFGEQPFCGLKLFDDEKGQSRMARVVLAKQEGYNNSKNHSLHLCREDNHLRMHITANLEADGLQLSKALLVFIPDS